MAFDKYKNGAWQEPESGVKRYENGAWVDCEGAWRYADGAWKEVWSSQKWLSVLDNQLYISTTATYHNNYENTWWIQETVERSEDQYITYYTEGSFSNPTITLEYIGGCIYQLTGYDTKYKSGAELYIYTRKTDGTEEYITVDSSIGTNDDEESGTYNKTLSGEYDRIGVKMLLKKFSVANDVDFADRYLLLKDFCINGKLCLPSVDCIL